MKYFTNIKWIFNIYKVFTEPEANGSFVKITMPISQLKPKDIISGLLLSSGDCVEGKLALCFYPRHKEYYDARIMKVSARKRKIEKGLIYPFHASDN